MQPSSRRIRPIFPRPPQRAEYSKAGLGVRGVFSPGFQGSGQEAAGVLQAREPWQRRQQVDGVGAVVTQPDILVCPPAHAGPQVYGGLRGEGMALRGQPQQERHRLAGWVVRRPADHFRALGCGAAPELGAGVHHLGCALGDAHFEAGVFGQ